MGKIYSAIGVRLSDYSGGDKGYEETGGRGWKGRRVEAWEEEQYSIILVQY